MTIRVSLRVACAIAIFTASVLTGCSSTDTPETLLASAKGYLEKNDNKAAVIQLKNALQKNPDLAEARFLLGKSLLDSGDPLSAEKELRRALELGYPNEQVVPLFARSLVLIGQFRKVTADFEKLEFPSPDANAELQTALGDAYLGNGNVEAARRAYAKALAARPNYVPARLATAQMMAGAGDLPQALRSVESVLAELPTQIHALHLKGRLLQTQGNQDQALATYQKAIAAKKEFLPAHWSVISMLLQQNKVEEARKQLDASRQIAPNHPQMLYLQALVSYREKNLQGAREAIQLQLRAAPDNQPGLLLAAAIEYDLKSYGTAESHVQKVLQRSPNHSLARRMLIAGYLRNGQPDRALEALKPVLDKVGKDSTLLSLAGEVYINNGDPALASEYFAKAAALDPGNAAKRTAVAVSHIASGQTEKGIQELEQAAAADTGIRADMTLIAAHLQRKDYDKALAAIAQLEKKQPTSPLPHNLRGSALLAKGDVAAGRRSFERAVELDPTYFPAINNLAQIELAEKKPELARKRMEALLAKNPTHMQGLLALAQLSATAGAKPDEVTGLITKAISAHPRQAAPRLALIGYYVGAKDLKKAVTAAQEAIAAIPEGADILMAAGRAYLSAGDTNQAMATYQKLATLQPNSPQPYLYMAEAHLLSKNSEGASESLRKALALRPDLIEAQRAVIAIHLDAGRVQEALATAREVQKQRPKEPVGYIFEGDIFSARKNPKEALTAYRTGLKQTGSTDLAIRLHSATIADGAAPAAEQFATTWLKDHPKDDVFRLYLAQFATAKHDYKTASQHYTILLERQPNNALILNNLAWTRRELKDPKAIDYAEKANKLAPDQPAIMDTLGVLLMDKGDNARAVELLQKASAAAPQASGIRLNFARSLIKVGKKDAARKELAELAKLGDKFPEQASVAQLMRDL